MTLPSSGPLSLSDVNVELSVSSSNNITMNDAAVRTLAGVGGSGVTWSMTSLYGKSAPLPTGSLWSSGYNVYGTLGDGTTVNKSSPIQVGSLTTWTSVFSSAGIYSSFAIKTDGTLWAWGYNQGSLGDGTTLSKSSPVQIGSLTNWKQVSVGQGHTTAIKTDGTLWGWGSNTQGQLGDGTNVTKSSPIQVGTLTTWKQVAANVNNSATGGSSIAVKTDGTLWVWGSNISGFLGQGLDAVTLTMTSSPIQVGSLTTWKQVSAGNSNWMAIKTDGTLWACGANTISSSSSTGQLGIGSIPWNVAFVSSPVQYGAVLNWNTQAATDSNSQLSTTSSAALTIKSDGTLWGWGDNGGSGYIGNGEASTVISTPVQIGALSNWTQCSNSAAINSSGQLFTWGSNTQGQLGDGTNVAKSSPVQVGSLTNWKRVSSVPGVFSLAIKTDGTLWSWGNNSAGILGIGSVGGSRSSPVQVGSLTTWSSISTSTNSAFAIKTDGTLWVWGAVNTDGQLGLGTNGVRSSPVQVGLLTNWKQVNSGTQHTAAIKTDGTLWAWGNNVAGELGDGTTSSKSSPVQVGTLTNWRYVIAGSDLTTLAIKTDGTLWAWGNNTRGGLGDGTFLNRSSPVQVGTLTNWTQLAASTVAIGLNGTSNAALLTWGNGFASAKTQLTVGLGTPDFSSPVQVGTLNNWKSVKCGMYSTTAIRNDGTLWSWGLNSSGVLGDGTIIDKYSPIQIGSLTTWNSVEMAGSTYAIKTDGTLWAWGPNVQGALGDGTTVNKSSPIQVGSLTTWKQVAASNYGFLGIHG